VIIRAIRGSYLHYRCIFGWSIVIVGVVRMKILFFAHLQDITGCRQIEVNIGEIGSEALWSLLIGAHPGLAAHRDSVRLACNGEYASSDTLFTDQDELALIPPVSGG